MSQPAGQTARAGGTAYALAWPLTLWLWHGKDAHRIRPLCAHSKQALASFKQAPVQALAWEALSPLPSPSSPACG